MKKGFVFIETLIVLAVLSFSLVNIYSMFIKVTTDIEIRKSYDNINDIYKVDVLRSLIDSSTLNSDDTPINVTSTNCTSYMEEACTNLMQTLNVNNIYISKVEGILLSQNMTIKNTMKEYLKTIDTEKPKRYIIVEFNCDTSGNNCTYASLDMEDNND